MYGLFLVILQVLIVAGLRWWSIALIVPLNVLVLYVFHFDDLFRRHS